MRVPCTAANACGSTHIAHNQRRTVQSPRALLVECWLQATVSTHIALEEVRILLLLHLDDCLNLLDLLCTKFACMQVHA